MSWLCWLPLKDLVAYYPTVPSCSSILVHRPCRLTLISNHFVLMTMDGANGFQLNRQRHDFQDVHYVVHGRGSSAKIIWLRDPAVAAAVSYDAAAAVAGMILSSLASFSLVLRVRASPVKTFDFSFEGERKDKN